MGTLLRIRRPAGWPPQLVHETRENFVSGAFAQIRRGAVANGLCETRKIRLFTQHEHCQVSQARVPTQSRLCALTLLAATLRVEHDQYRPIHFGAPQHVLRTARHTR
jgi:hypothetical protein